MFGKGGGEGGEGVHSGGALAAEGPNSEVLLPGVAEPEAAVARLPPRKICLQFGQLPLLVTSHRSLLLVFMLTKESSAAFELRTLVGTLRKNLPSDSFSTAPFSAKYSAASPAESVR